MVGGDGWIEMRAEEKKGDERVRMAAVKGRRGKSDGK